jgi:hypothetical protein
MKAMRRWSTRHGCAPPQCGDAVATLTGYAYETVPNKAIIAGQTTGATVVMVKPGSLGKLAMGKE